MAWDLQRIQGSSPLQGVWEWFSLTSRETIDAGNKWKKYAQGDEERGQGSQAWLCVSPSPPCCNFRRSVLVCLLRWQRGPGSLSICLLQWSCEIFSCKFGDCSPQIFCFFHVCMYVFAHVQVVLWWLCGPIGWNSSLWQPYRLSSYCLDPSLHASMECLPAFLLNFLTQYFAAVLQYRLYRETYRCIYYILYIYF